MNINNFTIKAQESIQSAVQIAEQKGQQAVETAHLLKGVLQTSENICSFLFKKIGANPIQINNINEKIIESFPKVSGGQPYLSNDSNKVLTKAQDIATKMKDTYVSVEHILLGLLEIKDQVSSMLNDQGINNKDLIQAIEELRKGSKVDSQSAEDSFNALNRFAINLNKRASEGKLDPVIGRDEEIRRILQILPSS